MSLSWLQQTIFATLLLGPLWWAIGFLGSRGLPGYIFALWYFTGMAITITGMTALRSPGLITSTVGLGAIALALGLTAGAVANGLLFNANSQQANGVPAAIANVACLGPILIGFVLHRLSPDMFRSVEVSWQTFIGMLLMLVGVALVVVKV